MEKPEMKRLVAVADTLPLANVVVFYASNEVAARFKQYGELTDTNSNRWVIRVDKRYDFDEVLEFIKQGGE